MIKSVGEEKEIFYIYFHFVFILQNSLPYADCVFAPVNVGLSLVKY